MLVVVLLSVVVQPAGLRKRGELLGLILDDASGRDARSLDLFELGLEGLSREHPEMEHVVETISVSIPLSECSVHGIDQYDCLQVGNLKPYTRPGEPQLPMKTFVIRLPQNSEVLQVSVAKGSYRELEGKLYLVPTPQPVTWAPSVNKSVFDQERFLTDDLIYCLETCFPGKAVSYDKGRDDKGTAVFIRFYPVQYVPASKRVFLITDADINMYYTVGSSNESRIGDTVDVTAGFSLSDAENIIITDPLLVPSAYELESFHDDAGISTVVVNTTWIYERYLEAPDPPYDGYSNSSLPGWSNIFGYSYALARRMISFLMDEEAHPNLDYVTLLGNAWLVPPSYYIYIFHADDYNNWIPTDFFYGSPDYDLVPNYKIGRIPVGNAQQAEHVVSKIKSWNSSLSYEWFQNVVLGGGKPFGTIYYYGEMIATDSVNRGSFTGMNLTKRFHTQKDFDPPHLMDAFSGDTGMLYIITHGSGDVIYPDGLPLFVDDLLALPSISRVPVVVSIACMAGAFDTNILYGGFDMSFGEGVLLSNASGIAYIGGSRVNYGAPYFYLDDGEVHITKEPFMAGMLTYVFEAYHNGTRSLGGITKAAMEKYVAVNPMFFFLEYATLFEFCLLGDPALQLPPKQPGDAYLKPDLTAVDPEGYLSDVPGYFNDTTITISSETNSPNITLRRLEVIDDQTVDLLDADTVGGWFNYTFEADVGKYLVRFASCDGKEGWIYLGVVPPLTGAQTLVVDDDQGANYEVYYQNAISSCGYTYDTWGDFYWSSVGSPGSSFLSQYPSVIWLTGDSWSDTLSSGDRESLEEYLDGGGCLFISGQDIGYDIGWTTLYQNYLHANYVRDSTSIYFLEGISGDPIGDGLNIVISGGDGADNQWYPSEIAPADIYAHPVFKYVGDGYGAIQVTGFYKVVYFAFGFEAVNTFHHRDEIMWRVLDFFASPRAPVLNIDTRLDYVTIQEAIDAPETLDGHTILVDEGTYYENVVVNKTVSLIGENKETTIIDGNGIETVVRLTSDNITATGFTIQNSGSLWEDAGIEINSSHNTLSENVIINSTHGLLIGGNCNILSENIIENNHDVGIYLDGVSNNNITQNVITNNTCFGIGLFASSNDNTISGNNITKSDWGVTLNESFNNIFSGNNINNSAAVGVYFHNESSSNKFYHNNLINNTQQVHIEVSGFVSFWDDGYPSGGNYWSDYTAVDLHWGPYQNLTGSDGMIDLYYDIDANNQDNYPLMSPYEYWSNPIQGDIDRDMKVDNKDLSQLATAYDSTPEKPNWNPNCDFNNDDIINQLDLLDLSKNYGRIA